MEGREGGRRKRSHDHQASVSSVSPTTVGHAAVPGQLGASRLIYWKKRLSGGHLKAATSHPTEEETESLRG